MINLILGAPGGGKSYEAVVYHIIPALEKGRKVITNLPLNLQLFGDIDRRYLDLIELRTKTLAERPQDSPGQAFGRYSPVRSFNQYPFSHLEDYGDAWRHPDGFAPLYVVDEAHIALPRVGVPLPVEEWYSLHRHESADVLLITQSYGKLNQAVRDLVQVVYRVRKNVAFGSSGSYTRKVQDGLRGDVVNTSIRRYEKRFFQLYKSHTRGGGSELGAVDIIPFWRRWPVVGAVLFLTLAVGSGFMGFLNPFQAVKLKNQPVAQSEKVVPSSAVSQPLPHADKAEGSHPLSGLILHMSGYVRTGSGFLSQYIVSQNGQAVFEVRSPDLEKMGYSVEVLAPCFARVSMKAENYQVVATCNAPKVQVSHSPANSSGNIPPPEFQKSEAAKS
jgi:zona occludens toxin